VPPPLHRKTKAGHAVASGAQGGTEAAPAWSMNDAPGRPGAARYSGTFPSRHISVGGSGYLANTVESLMPVAEGAGCRARPGGETARVATTLMGCGGRRSCGIREGRAGQFAVHQGETFPVYPKPRPGVQKPSDELALSVEELEEYMTTQTSYRTVMDARKGWGVWKRPNTRPRAEDGVASGRRTHAQATQDAPG